MQDSMEPITTASSFAQQSFVSESNRVLWRIYFGRFITLIQICVDLVIAFSSYMFSYWLYTKFGKGWPLSPSLFASLSVGIAILYVVIMDRVGLYRREISLLNVKELRGIFFVGLYAAAAILSISFYIRSTSFSRIIFTTALILTPIALYFERQIFYKIHLLFHQKGLSQKRIFIYGAGKIGTHLAKRMFQSPSLGLYPVAFLDDEKTKQGQFVRLTGSHVHGQSVPVLGDEEWLKKCKEFGVELVFIALPRASFDRNQRLVETCITQGVEYAIVPNSYEQFIQTVEMFEIGGIPILRRSNHSVNYFYLMMKRILDFFVSSILIIFLSPLIFFIGIAIRWDSPGPIIFKQKRIGLKGKEFSFYKFRSMYIETPRYATTPHDRSDQRITKAGRWLRRTSLDELPQLFNVFRGDMSLVGPRPEMPFIVESYSPLERQRLEAKPGITGIWQISAVRGEPIHANLEYDLFYLKNRSILLDLAILVKTALSVIRGIGAI